MEGDAAFARRQKRHTTELLAFLADRKWTVADELVALGSVTAALLMSAFAANPAGLREAVAGFETCIEEHIAEANETTSVLGSPKLLRRLRTSRRKRPATRSTIPLLQRLSW
jgi:hypothetical protein